MASQNGNVPLDKNNKYDRQLRLWGDHGQTALELARVCLINASATGTEILKNLILPGIGSFTIVDGNKVQGEDVGNNFFLTKDSIGKPRAQITTELLSELNPDVNGDFVEEHTENLLASNPEFFSAFSIVVATNLHENVLLNLSRLLWDKNIPLLVCRCYGFIGYMRLVVKEHTVIESHPDNVHEDLRLDRPFPGLQNLCNSYNLSTMNKKEHSHTPWLILMYIYLQKWKQEHNGDSPKNYTEKKEFKELIKQGIWKNEDGIPEEEDNFEEAIRNVNTSLVQTSIPSEVNKLFDDTCTNINSESKPFWILIRALREYVHNEGNGTLPLRGSIPDMTADSERYIQLQQVYKQQADAESTIVMNKVYNIIQELGIEEPLSPDGSTETTGLQSIINCNAISENDIKTFCKNAAFLRVVRCRSLDEEYSAKSEKLQTIGIHMENEDDDLIYYVMLRAVDKFYEQFNRYPGSYNQQMETDIPKLKSCVSKLLHDWNLLTNVKEDYVHEMCRFGASEVHSVSAFMGGAAAQEVIKLVTHQFLPVNNTYIYNAIKQSSLTEQL